MTGVSGPDQTLLETRSTPRSPAIGAGDAGGAAVGAGVAEAGVGAATDGSTGALAGGAPDGGGVSASSSRTAAVIASEPVPNGKRARRLPCASTRKTSAVCAIA